MNEWTMTRRNETCAACGHAFAVLEPFVAYLYELPAAGPSREDGPAFERRDYCVACPPPSDPPPIAHWRTRRPEPSQRRAMPFDREGVLRVFEDLESATESDRLRFRFVLALLLWRRRVLKFDETRQAPGGESWRFHLVGGERRYDVLRPELDDEQIERLSAQLEQVVIGQIADAALTDAASSEASA